MNPSALDKPGGAADDDHIVRIVRLETQMDHVTGALLDLRRAQENLQRTQEAHHQAMLAGFASLHDKLDDVQRYLIDRQDRVAERLDKRIDQVDNRIDQVNKRIDQVNNRIDRLVYWVAGLTITNLVTMVGLILRVSGAI
ncbi:hypothetical protein GTP38_01640 [Duganella sp. FT94W]|uniref:Uncharacterized protein n=1 Tax=Duganella lactea TaxID=2692173 RepID=A0ABW9V0E1_9BURK|nr:hypothetical protein [Duganella lactea]MYM33050.1 hypothetical protein [Duganella lactea]